MGKTQAKYTYSHPRPAVTVDIVIVSTGPKPEVLLIRRKHEPFEGMWAIPGGFVEMNESLEQAARRELHEETHVRATRLEQLHTFGEPGRDPRGRTISVAYIALVNRTKIKPRADDDAMAVDWHSLERPPRLAFDHAKILVKARRWLTEQSEA